MARQDRKQEIEIQIETKRQEIELPSFLPESGNIATVLSFEPSEILKFRSVGGKSTILHLLTSGESTFDLLQQFAKAYPNITQKLLDVADFIGVTPLENAR